MKLRPRFKKEGLNNGYDEGIICHNTHDTRQIGEDYKALIKIITWRVSDWWCHLRKHIGRKMRLTTLCINGQPLTLPSPSELMHLN